MRSAVRLLLTASVGVVMLCAAPAQSNPVFLSAAYYNPAQLLPPPPADGSPEALAELRELQRIEKRRTPADFASAMIDEKTEDVTAFAAVMGPGFDLKSLPRTAELFDDVRNEENFAAKLAKDFFKRNRPWIVDPKLHACATDDPPQSSYPSGHATLGYSMAVVLAALAPEKAQSIMARAAAYAENRLVCSMHYRRDIVAGQVLGTTVAAELMTTAGFRQEFDAAREELRAAHIVAQ